MSKEYYYSEIFYSFQGEGAYTGRPTLWIRFHNCNLECNGFGQDYPTKANTWDLPYTKIDVKDITNVEDLPVFEKGCDSSYSWSKKFKHLMKREDVNTIVDKLTALLPNNKFGNNIHMAFTGGEPMMNQNAIVEIMQEFSKRDNLPKFVTVETNGTRPIRPDTVTMLEWYKARGGEWFWSVSPKLFTVSGEPNERAIKPDVVKAYKQASNAGQLKFVCSGTDDCWNELESVLERFTGAYNESLFPVWIMPVGARKEQQEGETIANICDDAIAKGYNVSLRAHVYAYGNKIGT